MSAKTVTLHTLGCKLNYSETSRLAGSFRNRGFAVKNFGEKSDVFVLNTCSVTENADRECRKIIRSVLRNNPDTYVIVTGCYAQLQPDESAGIQGVDLVLGNREKFKIFDYVESFEKKSYSCVFTSPVEQITDFEFAFSGDEDIRTRGFLKIQDGCSYKCSFCTIPLARGKSRSMSPDEVIEKAKMMIDNGYNEIILTGVNTGDYRYNGKKLIDILYELNKLDIPRIRISSIEPNLLTDDIIELIKDSAKFCRHFHIPLQSGDDKILGLMRRRYKTNLYENLIHKIYDFIPEACIGADVITGFPSETESSFGKTYNFIDSLPLSYLHVFTYSERRNTPAASFDGKVEISVRKQRTETLRALSDRKRTAFYKNNLGRKYEVLFEKPKDSFIEGFTDNYIRVRLYGEPDYISRFSNCIIPVTLEKNESDFIIHGKVEQN